MAPRAEYPALPIAIAFAILVIPAVLSSGLCPSRCRCEDEYLRASCSYAGLDVVPIQLNPEIRHLDLSGNRVASLHLTFGFYDNLESLDLSSNLIHTMGNENFALQQRLVTLNVSNNAIRNIAKKALKGLTSLRVLDLSNNNITDLDGVAFSETNELEYLNLSGNSIGSLPDGLLANLPNIRSLVLQSNSLLEMPSSNLALVPSLEELDLSYNLVEELATNSLPVLRSLVSLNLANNVIRSIAEDSFENLPRLVFLDLVGNNLTSVPTEALSRLSVLSNLSLGRNPLIELKTLAFRNLFELKSLDLRECAITRIHPRAFADNINLIRITLDGNHELADLPSRILYGARYLKYVSLRKCNLAMLQPTHFPVDDLAVLRVGSNPLVCNCSVHWLWNVIHSEERRNHTGLELDSEDILCADKEYAGKRLMALSENSLRCRLSPLYLSLSAIGCLLATATILALIIYVTRAKRRKRPTYAPPNRPELLVYVGRGNEPDKNPESYSRRLIARTEQVLYDLPHGGKSALEPSPSPNRFENSLPETPSFYEPARYPRPNGRDSYSCGSSGENQFYEQQRRNNPERVYAVADVTSLTEAPPEVLSLYRIQSPKPRTRSQRQTSRLPVANGDYDYEYDYDCDYEYERPSLLEKPHVVFV